MTDTNIQSRDQSSFMAGRSQQYAQTGPAPQPDIYCLPAAKLAIGHEDLEACNTAGKSEHEVVSALNTVWRSTNARVIEEQEQWVNEDYLPALRQLREARIVAHHESEDRIRARAIALEEQVAVERLVDGA